MNNWFALDTYIHDGRNPNYRKLANNTYAIRRGDDIAVRLHETDVLTFHADRPKVTYQTGGWWTVTTKDRINRFGPHLWQVWSNRGTWFLHGPDISDPFRFWDGLTLDPATGTIVNESDGPDFEGIDRTNKRTRDLITGYIRGMTDSVITECLSADGVGDCLYCQLSDPFGDNDHLESHLREKYYMPNLMLNAYKARGFVDPVFVFIMNGRNNPKRVRETVGKYLRSRLLTKVATR